MGVYPLNGTGPGIFPGPGGAAIDGAAPVTEGIREVVLHLGEVGEGRGGV